LGGIVLLEAVGADSKHAFWSIALTFAAPALVPLSLFRGVRVQDTVELLENASKCDDPFALVGAFRICADRLDEDVRVTELGDRLLDRIFGDMKRLETACQIFAAAFVVSTAHLAEHELLGSYPVF
jgi:hypothetical protein